MTSNLPSDEVAEDYKNSLDDLTFNSRWEISNLTVIAKENIPHAQAISRTIENHIKNVPPPRKLPALFLLDSIVKNVGTPYTLYFGRNLYQTFMNAYTLVDAPTRKKLDEMLHTWKQPVPGSLSTSPVFNPEVTRPIENALIRARTAAIQQQQRHARTTPEIGRPMSATPVQYMQTPPPQPGYAPPDAYPQRQPLAAQAAQSAQYGGDGGIESLLSNIGGLISKAQAEFAANPYDEDTRARLKALLDLQSILQTQQLPPEQLAMIREQVAQLSAAANAHVPPPAPAPVAPPPQQQSLFPPNALAALLASTVNQQSSTPPPAASPFAPPAAPSLLDSLIAAGLVSSAAAPPPVTRAPDPVPAQAPSYSTPPSLNASIEALTINVDLTPSSLKVSRPNLISLLYEARSNQCATCGRRFLPTPNGMAKKTAHLDWHFKVNQRMTEAAKRGQNRSWYVDELEWIRSTDDIDEMTENADGDAAAGTGTSGTAATSQNAPTATPAAIRYVPVPEDPVLASQPCPICQETFQTEWNREAQEWVWMDAEKVGSRIYHASCRAEATKDRSAKQETPEPVLPILGKRRAQDGDGGPPRTKLRSEVATG